MDHNSFITEKINGLQAILVGRDNFTGASFRNKNIGGPSTPLEFFNSKFILSSHE